MDATVHEQMIDSTPYKAQDERSTEGEALRESTPRAAQREWKPRKDRRDPIDILNENQDWLPDLVPIRFGRMMQSPFAFYRGSAAVMASDLATTPTSGIRVQACGDAHLSNFGGFATSERRVIFDINDFHETLRDMKTSAIIEDFDAADLRAYGRVCEVFDDAMCGFAVAYVDQAQRDHRAFVKAVRQGRITAVIEMG